MLVDKWTGRSLLLRVWSRVTRNIPIIEAAIHRIIALLEILLGVGNSVCRCRAKDEEREKKKRGKKDAIK